LTHVPAPRAADEPQVVEQQKRALRRDADARSAPVAPPADGSRQPHADDRASPPPLYMPFMWLMMYNRGMSIHSQGTSHECVTTP
jgi:hypothetical protein